MTMQAPHTISTALTPIELWETMRHLSDTVFTSELFLIAFKTSALIICATLVLLAIKKHKDSEDSLKQKISELKECNEKLQKEIAELNLEQVNVLEDIITAEPPSRSIPGFNPQEMKALSELANRLR